VVEHATVYSTYRTGNRAVTVTVQHLCEEGQGVVRALGGHLSDKVLGAILEQLFLYRVSTLQPVGDGQH